MRGTGKGREPVQAPQPLLRPLPPPPHSHPRGWTRCPRLLQEYSPTLSAEDTHHEDVATDHQAEVPGEGAHKVHQGRAEVGGPCEHQALGAEEGKGKELLGQSWGCGCQIELLQALPQLQDSPPRQRNHPVVLLSVTPFQLSLWPATTLGVPCPSCSNHHRLPWGEPPSCCST